MAVENITSENFDQYFEDAMQQHSVDEETATEIRAADLGSSTLLPMQQEDPTYGTVTYVTIPVPQFMQAIRNMIQSDGFMESLTEEEFDAIFD